MSEENQIKAKTIIRLFLESAKAPWPIIPLRPDHQKLVNEYLAFKKVKSIKDIMEVIDD